MLELISGRVSGRPSGVQRWLRATARKSPVFRANRPAIPPPRGALSLTHSASERSISRPSHRACAQSQTTCVRPPRQSQLICVGNRPRLRVRHISIARRYTYVATSHRLRRSYAQIRRPSPFPWSRKAGLSTRSPGPSPSTRQPPIAVSTRRRGQIRPYDSTPYRSDARAKSAPSPECRVTRGAAACWHRTDSQAGSCAPCGSTLAGTAGRRSRRPVRRA